jgi:hypothetical protein
VNRVALALVVVVALAASATAGSGTGTARQKPAAGVRERKPDRLDRMFARRGVVDLHADTALHGLELAGNGKPGRAMRGWMALLRAAGVVQPKAKNFTRHVTGESLGRQGGGVQVFSAVTRGVAPAYRASARLFARWFARYPRRATRSDVTLWLEQSAWVYRQVEENPGLLALAPDLDTAVAAIRGGRVGAQLAVEGAFPFEENRRNRRALKKFFADPKLALPAGFPVPTDEELASGSLLPYARRLGVQYIGLNHLASSCFSGSELRPNRRRGRGLSARGRRFVADAWQAGIMIDLAHASRKAQREAGPVIADIADQIDYVRARIGVDHIALGLDGDGFVGQAHATTQEVAEAVRAELRARGYSRNDIAKIFGGNYLHVLARRDQLLRRRARQGMSSTGGQPAQ